MSRDKRPKGARGAISAVPEFGRFGFVAGWRYTVIAVVCSRVDVETQTPRVMKHFSKWGMEIHAGVLDPLVHTGFLDFDALEAHAL